VTWTWSSHVLLTTDAESVKGLIRINSVRHNPSSFDFMRKMPQNSKMVKALTPRPEAVARVDEGLSFDVTDSLITVIECVRTGVAVTRPEIGRVARLGRSIVTQRVEDAIDLGLLEDGDLGGSTGGRAPRNLRFRAEIGSYLFALFGAKHVTLAVADLSGQILAESRTQWDIASGPEATLAMATESLGKLMSKSNAPAAWATVVGVPGPVEFASGRPIAPPIMPGWNGYDIKSPLEAHFGAPCFVDNDVNLMALGEVAILRENATDPMQPDLLFIKVGSGVGAGILSGGRVHRGANGAAGDIGHTSVVQDASVVCRCGQLGCLEAVAGGWALVRDGEVAARDGRSPYLADLMANRGPLEPIDIANGALAGDPVCVEFIVRSAGTVASTLATLVNFYNPHMIVVGGSIAQTGDLFLATLRQTVYRRSLPLATRDLRIVAASSDRNESVLGALELASGETFSRRAMQRWLHEGTPRAIA
jgi:predicted NBD/HSP70 family sugar kinase